MTPVERFAPSPTGPLHLGHAFSALTAWRNARAFGGRFLLRIEDIDRSRSRDDWETQIYDDLAWLGLDWERPVMRQSDRMEAYRNALQDLWDQRLLYPCFCSRKDVAQAASAPQEGAPLIGPDGIVYPGTCRLTDGDRPAHMPDGVTLRLDMARAAQKLGDDAPLDFEETGDRFAGHHRFDASELVTTVGDIVVARAGMGTSYHLSVVVDDAAQQITQVTRGEDLFDATRIHVLLQGLMGLPVPRYHHHRLIRDETGKRLAKRDDARAIATYRVEGATPEDVRAMVGL